MRKRKEFSLRIYLRRTLFIYYASYPYLRLTSGEYLLNRNY